MVKFFVPGLDHPDEAERFYAILKVIAAGLGGPLSDRRVRSVTFNRGGRVHAATVGEENSASGLPCVAIFEAARGGLYFIYDEGRLTSTGHPVGPALHVELFEPNRPTAGG